MWLSVPICFDKDISMFDWLLTNYKARVVTAAQPANTISQLLISRLLTKQIDSVIRVSALNYSSEDKATAGIIGFILSLRSLLFVIVGTWWSACWCLKHSLIHSCWCLWSIDWSSNRVLSLLETVLFWFALKKMFLQFRLVYLMFRFIIKLLLFSV